MLAELVFDARNDIARRIGRHPERADAALAGSLVGTSKPRITRWAMGRQNLDLVVVGVVSVVCFWRA